MSSQIYHKLEYFIILLLLKSQYTIITFILNKFFLSTSVYKLTIFYQYKFIENTSLKSTMTRVDSDIAFFFGSRNMKHIN